VVAGGEVAGMKSVQTAHAEMRQPIIGFLVKRIDWGKTYWGENTFSPSTHQPVSVAAGENNRSLISISPAHALPKKKMGGGAPIRSHGLAC